MNPAITFESLKDSLGFWLGETGKPALLVALLFCRPATKLAKEAILPAILDFHYRSGIHTQFYFIGYKQVDEPSSSSFSPHSKIKAPAMEYDVQAFNDFIDIIESKTKWHYSGGTDIILVDGRYNKERRAAYLDFGCSIPITLEFVNNKNTYPEIGMFFEKIFSFAKQYSGKSPTTALSDSLGLNSLVEGIKDLALRAIPLEAKNSIEHGLRFATTDMRKKA